MRASARFSGVKTLRSAMPWLVVCAFAGVYFLYACTRLGQFVVAGYDLGIFDQAVRHYAHFQTPWVPLKGDHFDLLGDHFHPVLVLLAPLYWVWDDRACCCWRRHCWWRPRSPSSTDCGLAMCRTGGWPGP